MRHGIGSVVGKGEKSLLNSEILENLLCLSMKGERRFPHGIVLYFDIRPLNTVSKPPSNGFEKSLFCGESDGKTLRGPGPSLAPEDLFLCKHAIEKEVSPASHQMLDPIYIHDINACSNDHLGVFAPNKWGRYENECSVGIYCRRINSIISRTARSKPTKTALAIML
jgi:hypothetical protein